MEALTKVTPKTELISFDDVMNSVHYRAEQQYDDYKGKVKEVIVHDDRSIEFIGLPVPGPFLMTQWSRDQLASWLGVRWSKFFDKKCTKSRDIQNEINRHLHGRSPSFMVRTTREGSTAKHAGTLRALLRPSYHPIDDLYLFQKLVPLRSRIGLFVKNVSKVTDKSSFYVVAQDTDVEIKQGDGYHMGFMIRNSEVGFASLSFLTYFWRLICSNGLVAAVKHILFNRKHTLIKDESQFERQLLNMFDKYATVKHLMTDNLKKLSDKVYETETATREEMHKRLANSKVGNAAIAMALEEFDENPGVTAYEQFNALTAAARRVPPDKRFDIEAAAGALLESSALINPN